MIIAKLFPFILFAALMISSFINGLAQTSSSGAAHWEGRIVMPDQDVAVSVDLAKNATGSWIGSLTFPKTTTVNAPLSNISVSGASVHFQLVGIEGSPKFDGELSADGETLAGMAANAKGAVPFELKRVGESNVTLPSPSSMLTKQFQGNWDGTLTAGAKSMRVGLTLSPDGEGRAVATLITVDDGNKSYPVSTVTLKDKELQLELRIISGTYRGVMNADGEITGEFTQGGATLPLTFKRAF